MATYTQNINPKEKYQLILYVSESFASDYVTTNTSTVTVTGVAKHNGDNVYGTNYYTSSNTVDINGSKYYPTTGYDLRNGGSSQIFSYSVPVKHNNDGTKTISVSWSFTGGDTSSQWNVNGSISANVTLQTIPRATVIGEHTGVIGENLTIQWSKAANFTHKLYYSVGSKKDELVTDINGNTSFVDGVTWTIPTDIYKDMPGQSIEGTLKLVTYNGTTQIGSPSTAKITLTTGADATPTFEDILLKDINSTTVNLTEDNTNYIRNYSDVFMQLSFNTHRFATLKKLTINEYTFTADQVSSGQVTQDGTLSYGLDFTYGKLNTDTIKITIEDSRGIPYVRLYKIAAAQLITYIPLTSVFKFKRIGATSGRLGIEFSGNYFNSSFGPYGKSNNLYISYRYKEKTESAFSNTIDLVKDTDFKLNGNTYYSGNGTAKSLLEIPYTFDYKKEYNMEIDIRDELTTLSTVKAIIKKGIPIIWWNGEKVTINGDLYIADKDGNNPINVRELTGGGGMVGDLPVGAQVPYVGTTAPNGWLLCDGSAVSRTQYAELFAVIGTTYGAGDGKTTFNLPDKRGKVSVGRNSSDTAFDTLGEKGGQKEVTLTKDQMPKHTHTQNAHRHQQNYYTWYNNANQYDVRLQGSSGGYYSGAGMTGYYTDNATATNQDTGGDKPHTNLQPYEVDNWIIKYSKVKSSISIGDNGNWCIDGIDTGYSSAGVQGPIGPTGGPGPKGDPGPMPVFTIGDVVSLEPGTQPYVRQRGTAANPILDFGIPGADGGNAKVIIDRWEGV